MRHRPVTPWHVLAGALVLLGFTLGFTSYPLLDPDEGRNAEIAREMAADNQYLVPRLDGLPYADKPVLFFAVVAAIMEGLGPTPLAARLAPLLFTLATLSLVWQFARRRDGGRAGPVAAIAAGAAPLTLGFARTVIFDSALTFFTLAALVAFYEAVDQRRAAAPPIHARRPTTRRRDPENAAGAAPAVHGESARDTDAGWAWSAAAWAALALGVLTKGPIALALPLMIIVPYALWRRAGRVVFSPVGPLGFTALVMPWLMVMSLHAPGFVRYALVDETVARLTTDAMHRTGPVWYFLPIVLVGALPWTLVILAAPTRALRRDPFPPGEQPRDRRDPYLTFLLLWIIVPLVFFSLSQSKRPQYMLPLVPGIALLAARSWQRDRHVPGAGIVALVLGMLGLSLVRWGDRLGGAFHASAEVAREIPFAATGLGAAICLAAAGVWLARKHKPVALATLCLPIAAIPVFGLPLMRAIGNERSAQGSAAVIAGLYPQDEVAAIHVFPLSLPFYLRRRVLLVSPTGSELTSNYLRRDIARWRVAADTPLRTEDWWLESLTDCRRPMVFVTPADDAPVQDVLASRVQPILRTHRLVIYGPCTRSTLAEAPNHVPGPGR